MKDLVGKVLFAFVIVGLLVLLFQALYTHHTPKGSNHMANKSLANPASVHCKDVGGTLMLEKRGDGGEYGVCMFEDNMQCEEWALYRGKCPVGGVKVTGYDTQAQVYCAISGGQTTATDNASCLLPNGVSCNVDAYYKGTCE